MATVEEILEMELSKESQEKAAGASQSSSAISGNGSAETYCFDDAQECYDPSNLPSDRIGAARRIGSDDAGAALPPASRTVKPKRKKWTLSKLNAIHHEILRHKLIGLRNDEIAQLLGVSKAVIVYTVNSTLGKQKLQLMQAARDCDSIDFTRSMKQLLPKIGKLYEETIEDDEVDLKLRIHVATTVAEKFAGAAVPKQLEAKHLHAHLSSEQIEELKQRGIEAAAAAGMLAE